LPLRVGIDVGLKHDSSAAVCAQKVGERVVSEPASGRIRIRGAHLRDEWKLNIAEVENYLRDLRKRFPVPACEIDGR